MKFSITKLLNNNNLKLTNEFLVEITVLKNKVKRIEEFIMSSWEIQSSHNQLERLEKKVWKESTINFVWLIISSNILFWPFVGFVDLKNIMIITLKSTSNKILRH